MWDSGSIEIIANLEVAYFRVANLVVPEFCTFLCQFVGSVDYLFPKVNQRLIQIVKMKSLRQARFRLTEELIEEAYDRQDERIACLIDTSLPIKKCQSISGQDTLPHSRPLLLLDEA